jgi:hypothetical protein
MSDWQPIETAPKDGSNVLLSPAFERERVTVGSWDLDDVGEGGQCWRCLELSERLEPTHWMPLPSPPMESATLYPARLTPLEEGKAIGSAEKEKEIP